MNIIWISPDTTTWIRNPCKSRKGELALDIVLEKAAVKQRGDAWRIVLDACLPVLHLIDTRRSIPYAIKQVQELLGISCAFDQAVQVSWKLSPFFLTLVVATDNYWSLKMPLNCYFGRLLYQLNC